MFVKLFATLMENFVGTETTLALPTRKSLSHLIILNALVRRAYPMFYES